MKKRLFFYGYLCYTEGVPKIRTHSQEKLTKKLTNYRSLYEMGGKFETKGTLITLKRHKTGDIKDTIEQVEIGSISSTPIYSTQGKTQTPVNAGV